MSIKTYEGRVVCGRNLVSVRVIDGNGADSYELPHHVHHSPDGFNWGYLGSGPAELARCILMDLTGSVPTNALYQRFKEVFIAPLAMDEPWCIEESDIRRWLRTNR